jgi:hypothetical protein
VSSSPPKSSLAGPQAAKIVISDGETRRSSPTGLLPKPRNTSADSGWLTSTASSGPSRSPRAPLQHPGQAANPLVPPSKFGRSGTRPPRNGNRTHHPGGPAARLGAAGPRAAGAPGHTAADGNLNPDFAALAREQLTQALAGTTLDMELEAAVEHVMGGFAELQCHPDVVDGVRALSELSLRLVTLRNDAASVAQRLLGDAGVADRFDRMLSVQQAQAWKA